MNDIVESYIANFFGYDNLRSRYYFIGMEEGCGPDWHRDIAPRFTAWNTRGRQLVEHLRDYHAAILINRYWVAQGRYGIKVQNTWRRLIQAVLAAEGSDNITVPNIVEYQAQELATPSGKTCLLELFPLPSPKIGAWPYAHLASQTPYLATRTQYKRHVIASRIDVLARIIRRNEPAHVVLYGKSYDDDWFSLVSACCEEPPRPIKWNDRTAHIRSYQVGSTAFWLAPHPNARGLPAGVFTRLGVLMRDE